MRQRVSTPGDRAAGWLAAASAVTTLGALSCARLSPNRNDPPPGRRTVEAAAHNTRQAPHQRRLHLLLGLSNVLMIWPALRFPDQRQSRAMPLRATRLVAIAGELMMLVTMLAQARAWHATATGFYAATSDEEKLRTLDAMARANTIWTKRFAVRLWGAWAGMTASLLAGTDRRVAAVSAAVAVPLVVAPPLPPLIFAARIGWCSTLALALLRRRPQQ